MPYKTEKLKLDSHFIDKRTKMLPCQKERAIAIYKEELMSIRGLARMFKVNKRTIQFILFPDRLKKNIKDREERGGWKQYYEKSKNNQYMKKHRSGKHKLLTKLLKP